jgi:hypothetical protein
MVEVMAMTMMAGKRTIDAFMGMHPPMLHLAHVVELRLRAWLVEGRPEPKLTLPWREILPSL